MSDVDGAGVSDGIVGLDHYGGGRWIVLEVPWQDEGPWRAASIG